MYRFAVQMNCTSVCTTHINGTHAQTLHFISIYIYSDSDITYTSVHNLCILAVLLYRQLNTDVQVDTTYAHCLSTFLYCQSTKLD